jgi:putative transposase
MAVVDGLKGFPYANQGGVSTHRSSNLYHASHSQLTRLCILERSQADGAGLEGHLPRQDAEAGRKALDDFKAGPWGTRDPAIVQSWRKNWHHVVRFFAFPGKCEAHHLYHKCH